MSTTAQSAAAGWYDDGTGRQRWWNGTAWTDHYADQQRAQQPSYLVAAQPQYVPQQVVVNQRKVYKTSHGFHLIMSIITFGLWLPVWLIVGLYNASKA
jgi:hypothetical protein